MKPTDFVPDVIEAVCWQGEDSLEDLALMEAEFMEEEDGSLRIYKVPGQHDYVQVQIGDYAIKTSGGTFDSMSKEVFDEHFERDL